MAHKEAAERVYCLPAAAASGAQALEAPYVTGGRGGQLRCAAVVWKQDGACWTALGAGGMHRCCGVCPAVLLCALG